MKNKNKPAKSNLTILRQICQHIPGHLTVQLARQHGIESLSFTPWSHGVAMLYGHLAGAASLNDICDGLAVNQAALQEIRGASVPSRNGLSHSNRERDAAMAESLYWAVAENLRAAHRGFATGHGAKNFACRFKRRVHLVDATTIQLVANCLDWAKHRRRKAAVKRHLRLELESFLPSFVLIDTAHQHEATRARELCAELQDGEIAIFDKGYVDLEHLHALHGRGVFWVTPANDNLAYEVIQERPVEGKILRAWVIALKQHNSKTAYPAPLRWVQAQVEVDGQEQTMEFMTHHLDWSARSVSDLYRCRWQIELFFKSLKQNLQLGSFLGCNADAVRWQIWMGLLVHLLMRFLKWQARWPSHFGRLFVLVRCTMWHGWDLASCLEFYGTAGGQRRMRLNLRQAYLPGFLQNPWDGQPVSTIEQSEAGAKI
jgi:Transposase DDE domain/Domain of unknown function (DUF4372)